MRIPKAFHDPQGHEPPAEGPSSFTFAEVLQSLWLQRYTGKISIIFRSGLPTTVLKPGRAPIPIEK